MSPTQLSLALLRKQGWYCEVTEKNMRIKSKDEEKPDLTFKQDLFGFGDVLCVRKGKTLLVQTTTLSNVSARIAKIRALVSFEHLKQAGWQIVVHGWSDKTMGGGVKVIDMTQMETDWSSIFKKGPRRRSTPRKQTSLAL